MRLESVTLLFIGHLSHPRVSSPISHYQMSQHCGEHFISLAATNREKKEKVSKKFLPLRLS